ncbi:hypothetical protein ACQ4PT_067709 [Festuca glaucescens]
MSRSSSIVAGSLNPPAITELDASEGLPPSILLQARVYFADRKNSTMATGHTGKGHDIQVSICFADPPALSYMCIHCPGYTEADFADDPRVVRSEKQFLLLHLPLWATGCERRVDEYYIYQVIRGKPELSRIPDLCPSPSIFLRVDDFGIYCCDDGKYILAGLTYTEGGHQLYSYSSGSKVWTVRPAHLERLLTEDRMPVAAHKVIQLGGSLLGWVDLWKGILVCDVLCQDPQLVVGYIPLPFTGRTYHHICPWVIRDVTCTNGSLKFIEIEHLSVPAVVDENGALDEMCDEPYFVSPLDDLETEPRKFVDWRATIWTLSDNYWCKGFEVHGNDILVEELGGCTVGVSTLRNLLPSFPTLSICGDDVVHMSTSGRLDLDKTHMISIDMSNNTLKALTPCPPVEADDNCPHFLSVLSNYLSIPPGLPQVTQASNSENVNEGLPQIVQPNKLGHVKENESLRSCAQEVICEPNGAQDGGSSFDLSLVVQQRNSENVHVDLPQIAQASNSKNVTGNKRLRSCYQEILSVPKGAQNGGSNFDLSLIVQASNSENVDADLPQVVQASNSENKRQRSCAQQVIGAPNHRAQNGGSSFCLSLAPRQSLGLLDIRPSYNGSHYEHADYPCPRYGNYQESLPLQQQQPTLLPNWLHLPNWFSRGPASVNPCPTYPVVNTASFRPMVYPFPQNDPCLLQTPSQLNPHQAYPAVNTASFRPMVHPFPQFPQNDLRLLQTPLQTLVQPTHFSTPLVPPEVGSHCALGSRHRRSRQYSQYACSHRMTSPASESFY